MNMNKTKSNSSARAGKIVSYFFIPVLLPLRVVIKVARETSHELQDLFYPLLLRRAKRKALKRWHRSGGEIYGIKVGRRVYLYDRRETKKLNKKANKLLKGVDYRLLTVFVVKHGRVFEK
jgi:hypothetical protein